MSSSSEIHSSEIVITNSVETIDLLFTNGKKFKYPKSLINYSKLIKECYDEDDDEFVLPLVINYITEDMLNDFIKIIEFVKKNKLHHLENDFERPLKNKVFNECFPEKYGEFFSTFPYNNVTDDYSYLMYSTFAAEYLEMKDIVFVLKACCAFYFADDKDVSDTNVERIAKYYRILLQRFEGSGSTPVLLDKYIENENKSKNNNEITMS